MREKVAELAVWAFTVLAPISGLLLSICVFVVLPLALVRPIRQSCGVALYFLSMPMGLAIWLLSAGVTFSSFGWIGLVVGLLLLGVGVIPMAIWAAFFRLDSAGLGVWFLVASVLVIALQAAGRRLSRRSEAEVQETPAT